MVEPGCEPSLVVRPSTFYNELKALVGNPMFSDLQFNLCSAEEPEQHTVTAHKLFV
ncbi:unnamed protein product, partial [Heterosigma akashiwo]